MSSLPSGRYVEVRPYPGGVPHPVFGLSIAVCEREHGEPYQYVTGDPKRLIEQWDATLEAERRKLGR